MEKCDKCGVLLDRRYQSFDVYKLCQECFDFICEFPTIDDFWDELEKIDCKKSDNQ